MRVLFIHNYYQQQGGEDVVFANEKQLLRQYGHEVFEFTAHNNDVQQMPKLKLATNTIWSSDYKRRLAKVIAECKPDVAHFHNTFMTISPSAYYACREAAVPIVQTLHNYRLSCVGASFFRDGRVCEDCVGKVFPYPGIQHGCYRDSKVASSVVAAMLTIHRAWGTYSKVVDRYIALTDFSRDKFVEIGLAKRKIVVKSNFLTDDPGIGTHQGGYALFVGRMTEEKGVFTLINAWRELTDIKLKVVGDGPALAAMAELVKKHNMTGVELMGWQPRENTLAMMKDAHALIYPSLWYEGMPMTLVEGLACGLPIVASRLGAMATMIDDNRTGLHFEAGNSSDLAAQVREIWREPERVEQMRAASRREYETKYSAPRNYEMLLDIYRGVCKRQPASVAAGEMHSAIR
jgi:glycosyltransferase involved in cell wall biosynthesis